jgi:hypothetical protein
MTTLSPTAALTDLATTFKNLGTHIAIGSGDTTPSLSSTALSAEVDRNAITTKTSSGATCTFEAFFTTSEPSTATTIREIGLFNAASGGTLQILGQPTIPVSKTTNKTMLVTITVTFANL